MQVDDLELNRHYDSVSRSGGYGFIHAVSFVGIWFSWPRTGAAASLQTVYDLLLWWPVVNPVVRTNNEMIDVVAIRLKFDIQGLKLRWRLDVPTDPSFVRYTDAASPSQSR